MQDDLIERWGFEWKGHDHGTHVRMADGYWTPWHVAHDRIAALEAKLAEKDALLRECYQAGGEMWECLTVVKAASDCRFAIEASDSTMLKVEPTLAKIKDATDAD